jgi:hypothetical protein
MAERIQNTSKHESTTAKQMLAHFFNGQRWDLNRCFAPGLACTSKAIKSHSIQNSRTLDLLARDGHVKMIVQNPRRDSLTIDFGDVGRNDASTFSGFCSEHDAKLFLAIDNHPFNSNNPEQLFLLAYRSVARELHACMAGAIRLQQSYQKRIELGIDNGNEPEDAGMLALDRMMASYDTYCYKTRLDDDLLNGNFPSLRHTVFSVQHDRPSFAVSGFFDLFQLNEEGERSRIAVNVFPVSKSETVVALSFTDLDSANAVDYLRDLTTTDGEYQKYLLSKLVLMHCENFVIAPDVLDGWTKERVDEICKFYVETVHFDKAVESANLYLF